MEFIETPRFPVEISYDSTGDIEFLTEVTAPLSAVEVRNAQWSQERRNFVFEYQLLTEEKYEAITDYFRVCMGRLHEFRAKDHGDYKSCPLSQTPSALDIVIGNGNAVDNLFQLVKNYTTGALTYQKDITKPVVGTVLTNIDGVAYPEGINIDHTTGKVSLVNWALPITAITNTNPARISTGTNLSGLVAGTSIYLQNIGGTIELNDARYEISSVNGGAGWFEIALDATAFGVYTSGGNADTILQEGEVLTAGFEYDVPVRFDTDRLPASWRSYKALQMAIPLVEVK